MPNGSRPPEGAIVYTNGGAFKMVNGSGVKVSNDTAPPRITGPSGGTQSTAVVQKPQTSTPAPAPVVKPSATKSNTSTNSTNKSSNNVSGSSEPSTTTPSSSIAAGSITLTKTLPVYEPKGSINTSSKVKGGVIGLALIALEIITETAPVWTVLSGAPRVDPNQPIPSDRDKNGNFIPAPPSQGDLSKNQTNAKPPNNGSGKDGHVSAPHMDNNQQNNESRAGEISVDDFISANVPKQYQTQVKNAFESDAKVTTLTKDTTVYRYYGGTSQPSSYWVTPTETSNPISDLALPPGNTAQYMDTIVLTKGTTILEGTVSKNFGQPGGGYQYYVPILK